MRITGGELRGRRILAPQGHVRPTQDKVRQAMFSSLADRIAGCRFLDLYAGSGAVGLEAWSRGAGFVCWVESDHRVFAVLRRNVASLCRASTGVESESGNGEAACRGLGRGGLERGAARPIREDAIRFLRRRAGAESFDIIFADPPYDAARGGWLRKALQAMEGGSMLAEKGVFVVEVGGGTPDEEYDGWVVTRDRAYGGTRLRFFER